MGLIEFKEKLFSDKEFAKKFKNIETAEEATALASKEGFNFTVEELKANEELTDEELEGVAGGVVLVAPVRRYSLDSRWLKAKKGLNL